MAKGPSPRPITVSGATSSDGRAIPPTATRRSERARACTVVPCAACTGVVVGCADGAALAPCFATGFVAGFVAAFAVAGADAGAGLVTRRGGGATVGAVTAAAGAEGAPASPAVDAVRGLAGVRATAATPCTMHRSPGRTSSWHVGQAASARPQLSQKAPSSGTREAQCGHGARFSTRSPVRRTSSARLRRARVDAPRPRRLPVPGSGEARGGSRGDRGWPTR